MSSTSESVTSNLPPYLAAAYQDAAQRGLALSREPYQAYPGRRVAQPTRATHHAFDLAQNTGAYAPYLRAAETLAHRGAERFPHGYRQYMDPHQEALTNNIATQGHRVFKEKTMPELDARFIRLGQYGSKKHAQMSRNQARDIQKEILAQQEEAMAKGYQQAMGGFNLDRARDLKNAGLMNSLGVRHQAGQLSDIQALREAGMLSQDREQEMLDQAYEDWKERRRHPYERLAEYFRVLQGTPSVPSTYRRSEVARPSDIYHGADWRNIVEGIGINALGRYGRDLLGQME